MVYIGIDKEFLFGKTKTYVFILTYQSKYYGHIYGWKVGDRFKVIGIRTSILNLLNKSLKGVSLMLIDSIINFAKSFEVDDVFVIEPIGTMPEILKKYGFKLSFNGNYIFKLENKTLLSIPIYQTKLKG